MMTYCRWDGMYFVVDGSNAMQLDSYEFQYKSFVWPLTPGFHTLQWIYHKAKKIKKFNVNNAICI